MLSIHPDTLIALAKEAFSREQAHTKRAYDIQLYPNGFLLRVQDRSSKTTYSAHRVICFDALAVAGMNYANAVFDNADAMVERALSASQHKHVRESLV